MFGNMGIAVTSNDLRSSHGSFDKFVVYEGYETDDVNAPLTLFLGDKSPADDTHRPNGKLQPDRKLIYTKDIGRQDDSAVLSCLEKVQKAIQGKITRSLNDRFQGLHQRRAQKENIVGTHEVWAKELKELNAELKRGETESQKHYDFIAVMQEPDAIASSLSHLFALEFLRHPLKHKAEELITAIDSEHYQASLRFYKVTLKKIETLLTNNDPAQKEEALGIIFEEIKAHIESLKKPLEATAPIIAQEVELLIEELYRFIIFACTNVSATLQEDRETLKSRLSELAEKANGEAIKYASQAPQAEVRESHKPYIDRFFKKAKFRILPDYDDFRDGQFFSLTPLFGIYKDITKEVGELKAVARTLHLFLETIQSRILDLCTGSTKVPDIALTSLRTEVQHYNSLLNAIENRIYQIRDQLSKVPFSPKVHAGGYYVAKQFAKLKEARSNLQDFQLLATGSLHTYVIALGRIIEYLTPKEEDLRYDGYFTQAEAVDRLYKATQATLRLEFPDKEKRFHERVRVRLATVLDDTLAKVALRTLTLTDNERRIPNTLFAKKPFTEAKNSQSRSPLPAEIHTYFKKRLLYLLHYADDKHVDLDLDCALYLVETDPLYKESMKAALFDDADFKALYEAYKTKQAISHEEVASITNVLVKLATYPQGNEALFRYAETKIILSELSLQAYSSDQTKRVSWLERKIGQAYEKIEEQLELPEYCKNLQSELPQAPLISLQGVDKDKVLYRHLITALFSSKKEAKDASNAILLDYVKHSHVDDLPTNFIKPLFTRWCLERYVAFDQGIPKDSLFALFTEYLDHPETRDFWRNQLGLAFMEFALFRFAKEPTFNLTDHMDRQRSLKDKRLWEQLIPLYYQYLHEEATGRLQVAEEAKRIFYSTYREFRGHITETLTYSGIARWCFFQITGIHPVIPVVPSESHFAWMFGYH